MLLNLLQYYPQNILSYFHLSAILSQYISFYRMSAPHVGKKLKQFQTSYPQTRMSWLLIHISPFNQKKLNEVFFCLARLPFHCIDQNVLHAHQQNARSKGIIWFKTNILLSQNYVLGEQTIE